MHKKFYFNERNFISGKIQKNIRINRIKKNDNNNK